MYHASLFAAEYEKGILRIKKKKQKIKELIFQKDNFW